MAADKATINDGAVYMPVEQYLLLDENTDGLYEYWYGQVIMLRPPSFVYMGNVRTSGDPITITRVTWWN